MTVETELAGLSDHALATMVDGIEREMSRLSLDPDLHAIRDSEEWPHAAWKAMAIMKRAIERQQAHRQGVSMKSSS